MRRGARREAQAGANVPLRCVRNGQGWRWRSLTRPRDFGAASRAQATSSRGGLEPRIESMHATIAKHC